MTEDEKWMELYEVCKWCSNLNTGKLEDEKWYSEYEPKEYGKLILIVFDFVRNAEKALQKVEKINIYPSLSGLSCLMDHFEPGRTRFGGLNELYRESKIKGRKVAGIFKLDHGLGLYLEKK